MKTVKLLVQLAWPKDHWYAGSMSPPTIEVEIQAKDENEAQAKLARALTKLVAQEA